LGLCKLFFKTIKYTVSLVICGEMFGLLVIPLMLLFGVLLLVASLTMSIVLVVKLILWWVLLPLRILLWLIGIII